MILISPPRNDIVRAELERFARRAQRLAGVGGKVDIVVTGNQRMRELNRRFRRKEKSTDVLSFPGPVEGGDIAICAPIAAENAVRYGHTVSDEVKVLILHGMLHLAGCDHERDNGEMAARENELRTRLGLPGSLIERSKRPRRLPKLP